MPKLMVVRIIMCLGAILLSTAPISQTFAQARQQEAQASGITAADTLSNSSGSAVKADSLQLLRPGATTIFPVADSAAAFDSVAAVPAAKLSSTAAVGLVLLVIVAALAVAVLIYCVTDSGGC